MDNISTYVTWAISLAAITVSVLAYLRSGLADRRRHEHRNVIWVGEWQFTNDGRAEFVLSNTGSTIAKKVRARVNDGTKFQDVLSLGTFKPGQSRVIISIGAGDQVGAATLAEAIRRYADEFSVNWVSKLGEPDAYERRRPQIF